MGLKDELGHGKYLGGLAERGIGQKTASRSVNIAMLSTLVSKSNWTTLSNLSPSKLLLLTSWTDDELEGFFSGDEVHGVTVEQTQVISVRELESQIKQNRGENNDLQQELNNEKQKRESAEIERDGLLKSLDYIPDPDMHHAVVSLREESAVFAQQVINSIEKFETVFDAFDRERDDIALDFPAQEESATASLFVQLKSMHAKISTTLHHFSERYGDIKVNDEDVPLMSLDEASKAYSMRQLLIRDQEIEELHRKNMREAKRNKREKPGPKVGSKRNKASA